MCLKLPMFGLVFFFLEVGLFLLKLTLLLLVTNKKCDFFFVLTNRYSGYKSPGEKKIKSEDVLSSQIILYNILK